MTVAPMWIIVFKACISFTCTHAYPLEFFEFLKEVFYKVSSLVDLHIG